ncbi:MAG: ABC transporter permease [Planctomycetes bacterium]|nr:ABC transporter permease [Planctomycetota bacterium]
MMVRRFKKHKLAYWFSFVLIFMFALCLNANLLAPYPPAEIHSEHVNLPPQSLHFGFVEDYSLPRLYVHPYESQRNVLTLQQNYSINDEKRVAIQYFTTGRLWYFMGVIPTTTHFFGVAEGETCYLLGTDALGQDLFSRLLYGGKTSLLIGLCGVALAFTLGITLGGLSGYYGGMFDLVVQRISELLQSIPAIPIWLSLSVMIPKEWTSMEVYFAMTLILACIGWTGVCRDVRGKLLSLREEDYAKAAMLCGASEKRIVFVHLVPNFMSHIITLISLSVPGMILAETMLSFLNLGLRPPMVSWGVLLQQSNNVDVVANQPWLLLPGMAVVITVLAYNFIGEGLRDAADPYAN